MRIEHDRAGIRAGLLRDECGAGAIRPDIELLDRRRAKRIARGEHDRVPGFAEAARELADGRGLAGAVDADDQDHERLARSHRRRAAARHGARISTIDSRSAAISASTSASSLRATRLLQAGEDVLRRFDADVRGQQARLELIERVPRRSRGRGTGRRDRS